MASLHRAVCVRPPDDDLDLYAVARTVANTHPFAWLRTLRSTASLGRTAPAGRGATSPDWASTLLVTSLRPRRPPCLHPLRASRAASATTQPVQHSNWSAAVAVQAVELDLLLSLLALCRA